MKRYYAVMDVAERFGEDYAEQFKRQVKGENPLGIELYRWSTANPGRVFMSGEDANRYADIVEFVDEHGERAKPFAETYPDRESYTIDEIAEILGITRIRSYQFFEENKLEYETVKFVVLRFKDLQRMFGELAVKRAGITSRQTYYYPEEVAERLGIDADEIHALIESGELETAEDSRVTERPAVRRENLEKFIENSVRPTPKTRAAV